MMKLLMDLFLFVMFALACWCYILCYQHATDHTLVDKVGTGFITIMTTLAFVLIRFGVHDD